MDVEAEPEEEQVTAAVGSSATAPPPSLPVTRSTRSFDCRQRLGAVLCSHVGVAIVLSAYCAMGAFLFRALESPAEYEARSRVARLRDESFESIWRLGVVTWQDGGSGGGPVADQAKTNFTEALRELLRRYQNQIGAQGKGSDYYVFEPDAAMRWSFVGALLYSVTIMTTVGYGHVTPRTNWGRLLTIIYGLIGIPLMVLYLWKMGGLLAEGFRLFYQKVCCDLCCCKRCERARRRRRGTIVYQSRSDALTAGDTYSYRMGYSRRGRPSNCLAVESPVDITSDPTQGLLVQSENLEFMRGDSEAATCVNMAFHSSLPRATSRASRDWRTQSSHVYETISLIDDVNSGHMISKTRPRSFAVRGDSRVHYSKSAWPADQQVPDPEKVLVAVERERTLDRRSGVESRDRTLDRKTSDTSHLRSSQRQASQVKVERKPSRLSASEAAGTNSLGRNKKQVAAPSSGTERTETKPSTAKQKRPVATRRHTTGTSPRLVRAKAVPTLLLDGRRQKRASNHQHQNHQTTGSKNSSSGPSDRQQKKRARRRETAATGSPDAEEFPNGMKSSQLGQSDESFVTAPDDSSSEIGSSETGSVEDDPGNVGVSRRKSSQEEPRKKKKRLGSEKRRKRPTTDKGNAGGGPAPGRHPLTANSIEDGTDLPKTGNPIASGTCTTSDDEYVNSRRKVPVPIGACIMVMVTYVFAGSLGFSLWEGWDYATGPYFCFVTLSTIGLGDFVPGADTRRTASTEKLLVCTVWLMLGLTLIAMCAILIAEHFGGRRSTVSRNSSRR